MSLSGLATAANFTLNATGSTGGSASTGALNTASGSPCSLAGESLTCLSGTLSIAGLSGHYSFSATLAGLPTGSRWTLDPLNLSFTDPALLGAGSVSSVPTLGGPALALMALLLALTPVLRRRGVGKGRWTLVQTVASGTALSLAFAISPIDDLYAQPTPGSQTATATVGSAALRQLSLTLNANGTVSYTAYIRTGTPPTLGNVPDQSVTSGNAITPINLASYASLTEGDAITGYRIASGTLPSGLSLNTSSGAISGTPAASGSFTVQAQDRDGWSTADSVTITVTAAANHAPTASDFTLATSVTAAVNGNWLTLSGAADIDSDPLTASIKTQGTKGTFAVTGTSLSYTPSANQNGTDTGVITVSDGKGGTSDVTVSLSGINTLVVSGLLNDTGITAMGYDAAGAYLATCTGAAAGNDCNTGRDATSNDPTDGPAGFSFTKLDASGNDLPASAGSWSCVKDNVTGLIWENKTAANGGLTYTNYDNPANYSQAQIDASTNSIGYKNAVNQATLCGANDWRLPTLEELLGIMDFSLYSPVPTTAASWFPNTQGDFYWSSSPFSGNSGEAWFVHSNDYPTGGVHYVFNANRDTDWVFSVRLVRGTVTNANRYQISADGQEVTDSQTGLIWRRCVEGMSWNGTSCIGTYATYTHVAALAQAASANYNGQTWRLPNVKELASIVDRGKSSPAIDTTAFPATPSTYFWSSSPSGYSNEAWFVEFSYGYVNGGWGPGGSFRLLNYDAVRLVRAAQ